MYFANIHNFLTDNNENIVGYIISHKNRLNSRIFCAKNQLLEIFVLPLPILPWFVNAPIEKKGLKKPDYVFHYL